MPLLLVGLRCEGFGIQHTWPMEPQRPGGGVGRRGSGEVDAEKVARGRGEQQGIENMERKGSGWRLDLGV